MLLIVKATQHQMRDGISQKNSTQHIAWPMGAEDIAEQRRENRQPPEGRGRMGIEMRERCSQRDGTGAVARWKALAPIGVLPGWSEKLPRVFAVGAHAPGEPLDHKA